VGGADLCFENDSGILDSVFSSKPKKPDNGLSGFSPIFIRLLSKAPRAPYYRGNDKYL